MADELTAQTSNDPARLSYRQLVRYNGATWNDSEHQWEHDISVGTLGVASEWRTIPTGDLSSGRCPPVGVDNPYDASCSEDVDYGDDCLGPVPLAAFANDNAIEMQLADWNFGHIEAAYQSDQLQFWDHTPFLKDGVPPHENHASCLGNRYEHPELIEHVWDDSWDATASPSDFLPEFRNQRNSTLSSDYMPNPDEETDAAMFDLGLFFADVAAAAAGAATAGTALLALSGGKVVFDLIKSMQPQPVPDPSVNEAFHEEIRLHNASPIVGNFARVTIPADPPGDGQPERTTLDITSRVLAAYVQTELTTSVELWTAPAPDYSNGYNWAFDDEMSTLNMTEFGTDVADNVLVPNNLDAPQPTITDTNGNRPPSKIEMGQPLRLSGEVELPGRSELVSYGWIWTIEQTNETPKVGRACSNDASSIEDIDLYGDDFDDPGVLTVYLLVRDQTGLTETTQVSIQVGEAETTPTETAAPTPTPTEVAEPANFQITSVDAPSEVETGGDVHFSPTIENTGGQMDTKPIEYYVRTDGSWEQVGSADLQISAGDQKTWGSPSESTAPSTATTLEYKVTTPSDTATGTIEIVDALTDAYAALEIDHPDQVDVGQPVDFEARVDFGKSDASQVTTSLELIDQADGAVVDETDVTGTPESNHTVTLTRPGSQNGDHGVFDFKVATKDESFSGTVEIGQGTGAAFEIVDTEYPTKVDVNGRAYVNVTVENAGQSAAEHDVKFGVRDSLENRQITHLRETETISLDPGERTTTKLQDESRYDESDTPVMLKFVVRTPHDTAVGDVRYGDYSIFDIRNVNAPDQVPVGNPIDVTVDLAFGDTNSPETWTDTVELVNDADGSVIDSATISADPQKTTTVTLTRPGSQNSGDGVLNYTVRTSTASQSGSVTIGEGITVDCFITTATHKRPATLDSLRRFRDESMSATPLGRALVWLYYRISPPIAETLSEHPESRTYDVTQDLVEQCGDLSDRQEATDSRVEGALLGVQLTLLYVVGILVGAFGHGAIRARERLDE